MNRRTFTGQTWAVFAVALAIGAAACGHGTLNRTGGPIANPPLVLTLADGEVDLFNAQPFAAAVRRLSHGSLQIKIEGGWRPTDSNYEPDLIKDVRAGKAQLGITASRAFDTVGIDDFQALQAPLLIDNYTLERKVLASDVPGKMLQALRSHGLVGLAVLPGPLRRPLGLSGALVTASSYRGARIGIRPSEVTADMFRALGAIPVTMTHSSSGESTAGLTGIEGHAYVIDSGFAVPHAVLTGNVVFEPRPNVIFMNQRAFDRLTRSERDVLVRAAAQARTAPIYQGNDTAAVADLCRRGIKIVSASPAELAGLRAAMRPVYRALDSNPLTRAYIDEITTVRRRVGGAPSALRCPAGSTGGTAATAAALMGSWQVTYTLAELNAAGAYPGEGTAANVGHFSLTFSKNRWSVAGPPGGSASGSYIVAGDKITFYRHDHAYAGSDTEVWGPYTWSVYRSTLTFKKAGPPGVQMPTSLVVKPWRKT